MKERVARVDDIVCHHLLCLALHSPPVFLPLQMHV